MPKRNKLFILIFLFSSALLSGSFIFYSSAPLIDNVCISAEEKKLYDLITEYRKKHKLPVIPLSKSLCFVAREHVKDLAINRPDKGDCNMHSWSDKGKWSPCCYTDDHKKATCMWDKPSELTSYKGAGFEISCIGVKTAESALEGWKGSPGHNNVIINSAHWKKMAWHAMGIGMYGGYAVVWFGEAVDKEGKPEVCE
jgi:Cysteine-rich secretory protein family